MIADVNQKAYFIFVLGYDLMQDRLLKVGDTSCDLAYAKCERVWEQFIHGGHNKDMTYSTYENLQRFIQNTVFDFEK